MKRCGWLVLSLAVLAGCGSDDKGRPNVAAPVNNIQDNVEYKKTTEDQLRSIGKKNAEQANEIMDQQLNKSKKQ